MTPHPCTHPLGVPDWDTQVASLPGATFFHSRAWAQVLVETYGYHPVYVVKKTGDRFDGVLPLMEVNSWLTGRRGIALPFTDACAPLASDPATARALLDSARAIATERRWATLEFRGGSAALGDVPASTSFLHHHLELLPDETAQFDRLAPATRRAVRKSAENDLTIRFSQSLESTRDFYQLHALTRRRHGVPPQPFAFFGNLQKHALAPGHGWIVLAHHRGTAVAGVMCLHFGCTALYKFGASDDSRQHLRANNAVMWAALRHYAREGLRTFDFGRTSLDNPGLRQFKLGWGPLEQPLDYVRLNCRTGQSVTVKDAATGWHNRIFRTLPLSISRLIGSALYKHIP